MQINIFIMKTDMVKYNPGCPDSLTHVWGYCQLNNITRAMSPSDPLRAGMGGGESRES